MTGNPEAYYFNACLEIEAALESLINLSDIVEDIAMEAATEESNSGKGDDTTLSIDKKKKTLAVKKMAEDWITKFKEWGERTFDKAVNVPVDLDEGQITKKVNEILQTFDTTKSEGKRFTKNMDEVQRMIKDLEAEFDKLNSKETLAKIVKRPNLFKAIRNKLIATIKRNSMDTEIENYAESIRDQIRIGNKIMDSLGRADGYLRDHNPEKAQLDTARATGQIAHLKKVDENRETKKNFLNAAKKKKDENTLTGNV